MSTLASVVEYGLYSALPAAGIPGRIYYCSDSTGSHELEVLRDNGSSWDIMGYFSPTAGGGGGGSSGGVNAQTANYTAVSGDAGKIVSMNKSTAITLTLPASPPSSTWAIYVQNIGIGLLTISPNSLNIDGSGSNLTVPVNQGLYISTDGTNYFSSRGTPANYGALIANNSTQGSIANGTTTALTFPTVVRDDGSFTGTANELIVPLSGAGWYIVTGGCQWPGSTSGLKGINVLINGVLPYGPTGTLPRVQLSNTNGNDATINPIVIYLNAGDVITVTVFQNAGGALTMQGAFLSCARIN